MFVMIKRLLIIGALVAIVLTGVIMFFTRDTNPTKESALLKARVETLVVLLGEGKANARDGALRQFVAEASTLVLSDKAAMDASLLTVGIKKTDKATKAAESDSDTFAKLSSAKLNGQFDSVYPGMLEQKMESTSALMLEVQSKTPNPGLKASLTKSRATLKLLLDRLSKF